MKSVSKNTDRVVLGNDAGPKKYVSYLEMCLDVVADTCGLHIGAN